MRRGRCVTVIVEVPAAVVARSTETVSTPPRLRQNGSGTFVDREIPLPVLVMSVISSRSWPRFVMPKVNVLCVAPKLSALPLSLSWPGPGAWLLASAGSGGGGKRESPGSEARVVVEREESRSGRRLDLAGDVAGCRGGVHIDQRVKRSTARPCRCGRPPRFAPSHLPDTRSRGGSADRWGPGRTGAAPRPPVGRTARA